MSERIIESVTEQKEGRKWKEIWRDTDPREIYDRLAHDLIAKKLNGCTYIRSVKRVQHYDGFITIIVTYGDNVRTFYTIEDN